MKMSNKCVVNVTIDRTQGGASLLEALSLIHRHFQKEIPTPILGGPESGIFIYKAPTDLLGMVTISQPGLVDTIEEVSLAYAKKP